MLFLPSAIIDAISLLDKRRDSIKFALMFMVLFVLFAFNTANADYATYAYQYQYYYQLQGVNLITSRNGLYIYLVKLFNIFGCSYQGFLAFEATVGLLAFAYIAKKICYNPNNLMALYFIYPFMIDVTQVRNFLASAILAIAIYNIIYSTKRYHLLKAFGLICIATGLHFVFIIYFAFLAIPKLRKWDVKSIAIITGCILALEFAGTGLLMRLSTLFSDANKTDSYFSRHVGVGGAVFLTLYFLYIYYEVFVIAASSKSKVNKDIFSLSCMVAATIPLSYISFEFMRLFRNVLLFIYALIINDTYQVTFANQAMYKSRSRFNMQYLSLVGMVILSLIALIAVTLKDDVIIPLFQDNLLLSWE